MEITPTGDYYPVTTNTGATSTWTTTWIQPVPIYPTYYPVTVYAYPPGLEEELRELREEVRKLRRELKRSRNATA